MISPFVAAFLGAALVEIGEPARGLDTLIPAAGGPELPPLPGVWNVAFHEVVTRAWLALRRQRGAELAASRAETAAAALGLQLAMAMAQRARAAVALAAGGGVASLTRRELEIAELVRARRTNREIAAELFLSEKTVESHLRHIFGKLGVSA